MCHFWMNYSFKWVHASLSVSFKLFSQGTMESLQSKYTFRLPTSVSCDLNFLFRVKFDDQYPSENFKLFKSLQGLAALFIT